MKDSLLGSIRRHRFIDLLFAGVLLLFMVLSLHSSRQESVTIDEFRHLSTGVHYWQSGDFSFDAATPPLWKMALAMPAYLSGAKTVQFRPLPDIAAGWEPWFVATDFMRDNAAAYTGYLQSARLINVLAAVVCLVLLYGRCRSSFGPMAALSGTASLAFSPTFLAHSHYATTDIIATLTIMAGVFLLTGYLRQPGYFRLAGVSFIFALALLCKFTALVLLPLVLLLPLSAAFRQSGDTGTFLPDMLSALFLVRSLLVVMVTVLLTVNIFYRFQGTGTPLQQMKLESRSLSSLALGPVGGWPLPLPRMFVEGFDRQKADSDYSEFPAYFMGKWSADGFRQYYLAAFVMKEPVAFLLLLAAALGVLAGRLRSGHGRAELLLLCYVPVTLFFVLSCLNRLNVGVRYLLPAYPFFCLFIAQLHDRINVWRGLRLLLPFLLALQMFSVLRISPHFISYFNEFCGGAANGSRYLIDSNIDWGQDLPSLRTFMTQRGIDKVQLAYFGHGLPEHYGIHYEPLSLPAKPGYAAVSVSLLQGHPYLLTYLARPQLAEADQFSALRNLQPAGRAGYSIMIFRID